jgi:predicted small lipoprotein YifL
MISLSEKRQALRPAFLLLLVLAGLMLPLGACGRKNLPLPPEGSTNQFPRTYPRE